ncbi:MAG: S8 family serine peptidase [Crocinitomicaceae bacterium]|nr:S8 family serine peptidase [Crocinitomicaceae bacterium]
MRLLFVLLLCLPYTSHSQSENTISGQLFVQLEASVGSDISWEPNQSQRAHSIFSMLIGKYGITKVSCPFKLDNEALQRTYLFEFDPTAGADKLMEELEKAEGVAYAEYVPAYQTSYTPNDPQFSSLWHLQTIQAELAWDAVTTQTNSIVIAVVDDAILLTHEDLQPSIWTNIGEVPGDNIDNDGNGYIDDVNGWDAADNDNDANPDNPTNSFFTHGTHCAGIAAARTDNAIGIASIGFNAQIMPVKASSLPNPGAVVAGYTGVEYAIINGADVISMSWGGTGYSATYQLIFDQAYNQGIVCVAAAGNSNTSALMYPASYNHVISVGATDQNDQKATFSNYGSAIDVMAPGVGIQSCLAGSNSSYGTMQGTSMACPMVAGLAALMLACDPNLSPDDVENCIEDSADDIYPLNSSYTGQLGAGRINASNAIACVKQLVARFEVDYELACPGQNNSQLHRRNEQLY